jgi:hypothetical protein
MKAVEGGFNCTSCGFIAPGDRKPQFYINPHVRVCKNCLARWVFETRRAVREHRPTFRWVHGLVEDVVKSLNGRIAQLERKVVALEKGLESGMKVKAIPKTKTALARELLATGMTPGDVATELGWSVKQVRKVKWRCKSVGT